MSDKNFIPLSKQPAYQEAISKVVEIGRVLSATTAQLDKCRSAFLEQQNQAVSPPSLVDRAMALAGGASLRFSPPAPTTTSEIKRLEEEQIALQEGLRAANEAAEQVERQLSHEAALKSKAAHKAAVKKIIMCIEALCEANTAEAQIRGALSQAGYHSHTLQHHGFQFIGGIDDRNGGPAYYYAKDAREYVNE